jgi:UDP:flavonoid glycosyltransferase YjiC (YdhE family)
MDIVFLTMGSRGDLQPCLALAKTLKARGHRVRIYAGSNFTPWIESHGIEVVPSVVNSRERAESELGRALVSNSQSVVKQMLVWRQMAKQLNFEPAKKLLEDCAGCDVVITDSTTETFTFTMAEILKVPKHIRLLYYPSYVPTRSGDAMVDAPFRGRQHIGNYMYARHVAGPVFWRSFESVANRFRRLQRLPTLSHRQYRRAQARCMTLMGYSETIVSHPHDWPANCHTTGYWFLDETTQWQPPLELTDFLNTGSAPVYVGFGSMMTPQVEEMAQIAVAAARKAGRRVLLAAGWAGLKAQKNARDIFQIDAAPHQWLFPRMAAVVHHGGAGTAAAALRAGVPNVIVPHFGDQEFWGWRVHALGLGPQAIHRHRLTVENLAQAISAATEDAGIRSRAQEFSARIQAENGVRKACDLIEDEILA